LGKLFQNCCVSKTKRRLGNVHGLPQCGDLQIVLAKQSYARIPKGTTPCPTAVWSGRGCSTIAGWNRRGGAASDSGVGREGLVVIMQSGGRACYSLCSWEREGLVQLMQLGEGGASSAIAVGRGRDWFS